MDKNEMWGILGGMGPLASTEFLNNIYSISEGRRDQDYPDILFSSICSIPDRTHAVLNGSIQGMADIIEHKLKGLLFSGATRLVICCYTAHVTYNYLKDDITERLYSLPEAVIDEIDKTEKKTILLCTRGARKAGIFESCASWKNVKQKIIFPTEDEQDRIQEYIYRLKEGVSPEKVFTWLKELLIGYDTIQWALGCTELHLLMRVNPKQQSNKLILIDPLWTLAKHIGNSTIKDTSYQCAFTMNESKKACSQYS